MAAAPPTPPPDAPPSSSKEPAPEPRMVGRYAMFGEIARGGMATVHYGRLMGPVGFSRTVAIKRLHPQLAADEDFVGMFLDEARLAARVQHPNVVQTIDVVAGEGELLLVMEYVQGESLSRILAALRSTGERVPYRITGAIINSVLIGLHAAHEAKNEQGAPLGIVHRDMSPQNVLVGADGVVRVFDFGVAKAAGRIQDTREGLFKGKLAYASPEQLIGKDLDRRLDIYAASVILWEIVCGRRMFKFENEMQLFQMVQNGTIEPPSRHCADLPPGLEAIILRGLATDPKFRFATAREMAITLEEVLPHASTREVAEWVNRIASQALRKRAATVEEIDRTGPVSDSQVRDLLPTLVRGSLPASEPEATRAGRAAAAAPPVSQATLPAVAFDRSPSAGGPSQTQERRTNRSLVFVALLVLLSTFVGVFLAVARPWEPASAKVDGKEPAAGKADEPKADEPKSGKAGLAKPDEPKPTASEGPSAEAKPSGGAPAAKLDGPKAPPTPKATASAPASAPPKPTAAPAANCSPPFTIDSDGIRHPKPECM